MRSKYLSATALLALALAACGGGKDGGPTFVNSADSTTIAALADQSNNIISASFSNTFQNGNPAIPLPAKGATTAQKAALAYATYQRVAGILTGGRGVAVPAPAVGPFASSPFSECTPTETGVDSLDNPIDTDADGVPDNYKVDFGSACTSEDSAGTHRTVVSGYLQFQDVGTGFYTFKVTIGHLKFVFTDLTTGNSSTVAINGSETFDAAAALASHSLSYTLGETEHATGNPDVTFTIDDNEHSTFDPDNGSSLSQGNPLPNGVLDMNVDLRFLGASGVTANPGNFRMLLDTPTPVHYNTACGSNIDAGQLRGLLNGQGTVGFTATWSSCADPVVVIFGASAPAAVAAR